MADLPWEYHENIMRVAMGFPISIKNIDRGSSQLRPPNPLLLPGHTISAFIIPCAKPIDFFCALMVMLCALGEEKTGVQTSDCEAENARPNGTSQLFWLRKLHNTGSIGLEQSSVLTCTIGSLGAAKSARKKSQVLLEWNNATDIEYVTNSLQALSRSWSTKNTDNKHCQACHDPLWSCENLHCKLGKNKHITHKIGGLEVQHHTLTQWTGMKWYSFHKMPWISHCTAAPGSSRLLPLWARPQGFSNFLEERAASRSKVHLEKTGTKNCEDFLEIQLWRFPSMGNPHI